MRHYFSIFFLFTLIFSAPVDAYIKTRDVYMGSLFIQDAVTMNCFPIRFPCNGRLDDFLNAVNAQRPLTPLIDPNEFRLLIEGVMINPNDLSRLQNVTTVRLLTTENQRYAPLKKDIMTRLDSERSSLINALNTAYDALPEEGNVDDIPYLTQYVIDTFVDNATRIYNAVHQYVNLENRYPLELFNSLLYNEIRSAAFFKSDDDFTNGYVTHNIKRCFFPNEIRFDLNGETMVIETASDYYRKELKK